MSGEVGEASGRTASGEHAAERSARRRRVVLLLIRAVLAVVVFSALGWHVRGLIQDWSAQGRSLRELNPRWSWLGLAAGVYLAGQVCFATYWWRLLTRLSGQTSWIKVVQAYAVGTIGKYVPGKALVVVIRTAMVRLPGTGKLWVGLSAVYETISMMAVGGLLAAVCLIVLRPASWVYWLAAALVAAGLAAGLHRLFFGRLANIVALPFRSESGGQSTAGWYSTFWRSAPLIGLGWVLSGASLQAVFLAMGEPCLTLVHLAWFTGAAALATTIGFVVVVLPAGVGVRELLLIEVLTPQFSRAEVVVATLLLRVVWTTVEIGAAGMLYAWALAEGKAAGASRTGEATGRQVAPVVPGPKDH